MAPDVDESIAAFCIDDILMMVQFSYSSKYYAERLKLFTGIESLEDNKEELIKGIMQFIKRALRTQ